VPNIVRSAQRDGNTMTSRWIRRSLLLHRADEQLARVIGGPQSTGSYIPSCATSHIEEERESLGDRPSRVRKTKAASGDSSAPRYDLS